MFYTDRKSRFLWAYALRSLAIVLGVGVILRLFFLGSFVLQSSAMAPSLLSGDFIVTVKNVVLTRGQVAVYGCGDSERSNCIRRVIGLPGDRIEFKQGLMILNGEPAQYDPLGADGFVRESWRELRLLIVSHQSDVAPVVVPPAHFYVLDDNRSHNPESGSLIRQDSVSGRAWRIWLSLDWYENGVVRVWPKIRWNRVFRPID